jgi:hypothetical protein
VVVKAFERFMGCMSAFTMKLFWLKCSDSSNDATATAGLFVNKLEDVEKLQEIGESLSKLTPEESEEFLHLHPPPLSPHPSGPWATLLFPQCSLGAIPLFEVGVAVSSDGGEEERE